MKMKKVMAAVLAATMVMASAVTASAATTVRFSGGVTEAPKSFDEKNSMSAGAETTVAGEKAYTTVGGVYAATSVRGAVVKTPVADVKAALNLTSSQRPIILVYDTDAKKSTAAMASVNAAVEALGGQLVTSLNIDLGAKQNDKWVTLKDGKVALAAGLPKNADKNKTYCVVLVQPGGATTILEDQDTNPNTVTFAVQAGLGTYAIVAK